MQRRNQFEKTRADWQKKYVHTCTIRYTYTQHTRICLWRKTTGQADIRKGTRCLQTKSPQMKQHKHSFPSISPLSASDAVERTFIFSLCLYPEVLYCNLLIFSFLPLLFLPLPLKMWCHPLSPLIFFLFLIFTMFLKYYLNIQYYFSIQCLFFSLSFSLYTYFVT